MFVCVCVCGACACVSLGMPRWWTTDVHNDIVRATDVDPFSALVLLDLSTAFDTVDHRILLNVLSTI